MVVVEKPVVEVIDREVDVPVTRERPVPVVKTVQRTVEVPQTQFIDKIVDVVVERPREVPQIQTVQKIVEVPQVEYVDGGVVNAGTTISSIGGGTVIGGDYVAGYPGTISSIGQ